MAVICASLLLSPLYARADNFTLADAASPMIGELRETQSRHEDTLIDLAREFDLGYDQIVKANPRVNRWLPGDGTRVLLPSKYILPDAPHSGIVINIAELRLYYFPPRPKGESQAVLTFPVSIGRMDWKTPLGETVVVRKDKDPAWYPPASIKAEHARDGDPLPDVIPGGHPENPLGGFALRLGIAGYLIHGVDERKANGIGMRVTHGCIRMYPEDVARLYEIVPVKTRVMLVNQPIKVGIIGDKLYAQIVTPLHEDGDEGHDALPVEESLSFIRSKVGSDFRIDEDKAVDAIERGDGIPVVIGRRTLPGFEQEEVSRPLRVRDSRPLEAPDRETPIMDADQLRRRYPKERELPSRNYQYDRDSQYDYDESGRRPQDQGRSSGYGYDEPPISTQSRRSRDSMPRSGATYRDEMERDRDFSYYRDHDSNRPSAPRDSYAQRSPRSGPTYQTPEYDDGYSESDRDPYRAQRRDRNYRPDSRPQRYSPPRSRDQRNSSRDYDSYADDGYDSQEEDPLPWDPLRDSWNWMTSLFE